MSDYAKMIRTSESVLFVLTVGVTLLFVLAVLNV